MRKVKYLSPTAVNQFFTNPEEFYLMRLAEVRPPRMAQTVPMACGSAFDAFVKSYLYNKLVDNDPRFKLKTLFNDQVEEQNQDECWKIGFYLFQQYIKSGALNDLMLEIKLTDKTPRFEITLEQEVVFPDGRHIPLLGKPDLIINLGDGIFFIVDWKVNGYMGSRMTSPAKGYKLSRDSWDPVLKGHSRSHMKAHKSFCPGNWEGLTVDQTTSLDKINERWATQLTMYAWTSGVPIGEPFVAGIDQLTAGPNDGSTLPLIRVSSFRNVVSADFQYKLARRIQQIWTAIKTGHIFIDLPREESDQKCEQLDMLHYAYSGDPEVTKELIESTRQHKW